MQSFIVPVMRLVVAPIIIGAGALAIQTGVSPQATATATAPASVPQNQSTQGNTSTSEGSLNWAGYVSQSGHNYTAVSGSWVVPTVASVEAGTADATWIGIGGVADQDLIQAGTQALIDHHGTISYEAWYETLPDYSTTVLHVHPGDVIHASIMLQSPDHWLINLADATTGQHYSTTVTYHSSQSSAEWIEEMVSNGDYTFRPLDNFGRVNFGNGMTVVDGKAATISQSGAEPLEMVNGDGDLLAKVSNLSANGASFMVARTDAPAISKPKTTSSTVTVLYGGGWPSVTDLVSLF